MKQGERTIPLLLFAKAPVPGKVKTRLSPPCTAVQSAEVAKRLLEETVKQATRSWPDEVMLAVWPDQQDPFIQALAERYALRVISQAAGDLGQKMHQACEQTGYPVAVMGCDAPHIRPSTLIEAHQSLEQGTAVLGPANDGGYYLIGLTHSVEALFAGIKWGGREVFQATQEKAREQDLCFHLLPLLNDVDTWQDVMELARHLPSIQHYIAEQKLV